MDLFYNFLGIIRGKLSEGELKRRIKSKKYPILYFLFFSSNLCRFIFCSFSVQNFKPCANSTMATSSIGNSSKSKIPVCGYNKAMRMFISNSTKNPKRRFWKSSNSGLGCSIFIWDDEVEHNTSTEHKNSIRCNCSEVV